MNKIILLVLIYALSFPLMASKALYVDAKNKSQSEAVMIQVKDKAALAVLQFQARSMGRLDYSPESLVAVEEMLAEASGFTHKMSRKQKKALIELMGSYILYVAYAEHGGKFYWNDKSNQPALVVGDSTIKATLMTYDKVRVRLMGDTSDNIPIFYKGFSERAQKAKNGPDAMYI